MRPSIKFKIPAWVLAIALSACLLAITPRLVSQPAAPPPGSSPVVQAPVILDGKTVFTVPGLLSFSAQARAAAISARIRGLSEDVTTKPEPLAVSDAESSSDIMAGDLVLMSVTDQ